MAWRINHAYRFEQGRYRPDLATEPRLLAEKYKASQLSSRQRKRLSQVEFDTGFELAAALGPDAEAVCDHVYYALRTGYGAEVRALLKTFQPGLQGDVQHFGSAIMETDTHELMSETNGTP